MLGVKSATFALGNIKIGDILSEVLDMVRSHHVRLEGDFVNVVLSILLLEGIGRTLDPNLDLFSGYVEPGTLDMVIGGMLTSLSVHCRSCADWAHREAVYRCCGRETSR